MPVQEEPFYTDDVKLIAQLIKENWALTTHNVPNIDYEVSSFFQNQRVGGIYVYKTSASNRISATDYQAMQRDVSISIRISNPKRDTHYMWCQEVYRILLAERRHHCALGHHLFIDITGERESNDLTAFYVTTIEIKLTRYNKPIRSAGFGDRINKAIDDLTTNNGA